MLTVNHSDGIKAKLVLRQNLEKTNVAIPTLIISRHSSFFYLYLAYGEAVYNHFDGIEAKLVLRRTWRKSMLLSLLSSFHDAHHFSVYIYGEAVYNPIISQYYREY